MTLGVWDHQEPENAESEAGDDAQDDSVEAASNADGTDIDGSDAGDNDAVSVESDPGTPPDSQVSSGWHGKAIMLFNGLERREKEMARERDARLLPIAKVVELKNKSQVFNLHYGVVVFT